jgi:hypothetical protein
MEIKSMAKQKASNNVAIWSFRREITLGTLLHLAALVIVLTAGWSNLQKELALIQHDLAQLITVNNQLQKHMELLADQTNDHEYRLKALEKSLPRNVAGAKHTPGLKTVK